ncbi:MAG: helix-turn-helix domain-containing protein [Phycisphaeraceae bacterium]
MRRTSLLHGQPHPARAVTRRRFPRVDFYGDEVMAGGLPGHRHERVELATVLEGRLHLGIDQQIYEARQGDWLLFAPRVLHGECALPQRAGYRLLWFLFEQDRVGCHMTRYTRGGGYELITSMGHQSIPRELSTATQHLAIEPTGPIPTAQRVLVRLVSWCLDCLAEQDAPPAAAHPSVTEVARLVRDRLDRPPTVVELANHVGLSPNYLSSLFHQQTGRTLRAFMDAARIEQAQRMLADPQRSVKQTAYQLGFADPHHFSRVFQRVTGQTPSGYRQRRREAADT